MGFGARSDDGAGDRVKLQDPGPKKKDIPPIPPDKPVNYQDKSCTGGIFLPEIPGIGEQSAECQQNPAVI